MMELLLLLGRLAIFTGLGAHPPWTGNRAKGRNRVDFRKCRRIARIPKQALQPDQGNRGDKSPIPPALDNTGGELSSIPTVNFLPTDGTTTLFGITYKRISPDTVVDVKKVVTGIKTADLLLKAIKAVHGVMILLDAQGGNLSALGSPDGIVLGLKAVKIVIKGVKMTEKALKARGVKSIGLEGSLKKMVNGMKVSWGALDLVRGSKGILSELSSGRVAVVNIVLRGYEASRGALSTVEALSSLKVGFVSALARGMTGVKSALSGIGVMIKALMLSKELYVFVIKGLGLSHGAREVFRIISEGREDLKPLSTFKKVENKVMEVRLGRRTVEGLWWMKQVNDGEGFSKKVRVVSSLVVCIAVYRNAWWYQESQETVWLSVQGLQTIYR